VTLENRSIFAFSCPHFPYHHIDTLKFFRWIKRKYAPSRVICLGDEADNHSFSYHEPSTALRNPDSEFSQVKSLLQTTCDIFPSMDVLISNHGSLANRKANTARIPTQFLKSFNVAYDLPDSWVWHDELTLILPNKKKCKFVHHLSNGTLQAGREIGMNLVKGHEHTKFELIYWGNQEDVKFSATIGCLIDQKSKAYDYQKTCSRKPKLGGMMIIDSIPMLMPMHMTQCGRWAYDTSKI